MAGAPLSPFQKLAAAFDATARSESRDGGPVELFPVTRQEAQIEVSLSRGVAPCLVVRAREEEAAPSSGYRKNLQLRTRARLVYPKLVLRRITSLDRLNTALALRCDVRTGDASFDGAVTIEADLSDEVIAQTFASKAARDAALAVLAAGFSLFFEERAIRADLPAPTDSHISATTVKPVVEALDTLVATVPRADPVSFSKRPQLGRVIAGMIVVIGLIAAASLAPATLDDVGVPIRPLPRPIVPRPTMIPGALAGAAAFVVAYLLVRWQLKRRNASTDLPLVLALFVVLATLGVGSLDAVNRLLDEAPLAVHDVKVISKETSRSRKSDAMSEGQVKEGVVTEWTFAVPSWREGAAELELSVGPELHRSIREGDTIRVTVHPGFLGWEWGAVIERASGEAAPAAPTAAPGALPQKTGAPREP